MLETLVPPALPGTAAVTTVVTETVQRSRLEWTGGKRLMVVAGRTHPRLAADICDHLGLVPGHVTCKNFANGETYVRYEESVRGVDVFIVQPTFGDVNGSLMELLLLIDAARQGSAHRITAVMPWFGYSRQDKKSAPREPISARLVADMLQVAGADRVITMDLHAGQIQGFFRIPVDHMTAMPVLVNFFNDQGDSKDDLVIVSPDAGRAKLAERYRDRLGCDVAILTKERNAHHAARITNVLGEVAGKRCVLLDDMIDTGGTLLAGAQALKAEGATHVSAAATHGLFSADAYERIERSQLDQVIVTDSVPPRGDRPSKIVVLSVAQLLSDTIRNVFSDESVSEIFEGDNQLF